MTWNQWIRSLTPQQRSQEMKIVYPADDGDVTATLIEWSDRHGGLQVDPEEVEEP